MNLRSITKTVFLIIALVGVGFQSMSQVLVSKMKQESAPPTGEGFFYSLPKTMLRIQLVVQKIEQRPGPLASFASDYLGVTSEIGTSKQEYRLVNVEVQPVSIPDESQLYFVQIPSEKSKDEKNLFFHLSPNGMLSSVNENAIDRQVSQSQPVEQHLYFQEGSTQFDYFPGYNRKKKVDTVVRKITIDTMTINRFLFKTSWVDKSERERAEEAAQQISRIREARFNLLTGYHEVNYGESIRYMDTQLQQMEQKYTELFLGMETLSTITETIYFTPLKGDKRSQSIAVIGGESVILDIYQDELLKQMQPPGTSGVNAVFYRIPAEAYVKISYLGSVKYYDVLTVSQLGVVATAPVAKTRLQFDPQTGAILGVQKE